MTAAPAGMTFECKVHFKQAWHGRKWMAVGDAPASTDLPQGHVPRLSRLMALAIRIDNLLRLGEIKDYAGPGPRRS
jgi:hypothetical protein